MQRSTATILVFQRRSMVSMAGVRSQAMKPGDAIPGLNFLKGQEATVARERSEYPSWVGSDLVEPPVSLARLRRMPEEDATDAQKRRYLKLTRRVIIKKNNAESGAK